MTGSKKATTTTAKTPTPPQEFEGDAETLELTPPKPKITPKFQMKGNREFRHDLYKLLISKVKKNYSYKIGDPNIWDVEHCHFYHNKDSKGKEQEYCQPIAGHFHKIDVWVEEDGSIKAKCGPPMQKVRIKIRPGKYKKVIQGISFENDHGDMSPIPDNHTHDVVYVESEVLSDKKLKMIRQANMDNMDKVIGDPIPHAAPVAEDLSATL